MKILILNWKDIKHPQVGGAEIIVYEIAKRLVADGHSVSWYCRNFKGGLSEETIEGIKIIRRGNLISTYFIAPVYYWSLRDKPDLVIDISNTIFWQSPIWATRSKKIAYLNQLAKEVFYYEYPRVISRIGIFLEKLQYVSYKDTRFICYAESTKKDLVDMGIKDSKISIFPIGIDHKRYFPGTKSRTPMFICVSRLVKMKRTDLAILSMSEVVKTNNEVRLVIVGTGYERKNLEKLRDKLNLKENVIFADENTWFFSKNSKDKKVEYMQKAWGLLFLSVKEGWGMTVTECAACGTPSIVTDVTGLRDSVKNEKTGIIISEHPSPNEVASAILRIVNDENLRKNLSSGAVDWSRNFNWNTSYSHFVEKINKI